MENLKSNTSMNTSTSTNTKSPAQDAFAALPGVACVKRAMEVAVAGAHSITIVDCNGYSMEYRYAFAALTPIKNGVVDEIMLPRFTVIQPCPCGNLTHPDRVCECSMAKIKQHRNTVKFRKAASADIVVDAGYIRVRDFDTSLNESAGAVLERIKAAVNAESVLSEDAEQLLNRAYSMLNMNAVERDRAVRVAATIAGLDQSSQIEARHVAEAVQYRFRGISG